MSWTSGSRTSADNSFICGWNHKVWVFIFLIGTSWTFWEQNWAVLAKIFVLPKKKQKTLSSSAPFVLRFLPHSVSRFSKCEFFPPTKNVSDKHLFHWWITEIWKSFTWKGIFCILFNIVPTLGRSSQSLSKIRSDCISSWSLLIVLLSSQREKCSV